MKALYVSALTIGLALGCSHSGDGLFEAIEPPAPPPGGSTAGSATSSGGVSGATADPGPRGGQTTSGTGGGGGVSVGEPGGSAAAGEASPPDPSMAGAGPDVGAGGDPNPSEEPPQPVCGNGKIEVGEECDDAGRAGEDGCEACQVVCSHFGQGAVESADHHCYVGYDEADFEGAVADCQARGAHLVTITSADENQVVRTLVSSSKYIGGFEDVTVTSEGNGDYTWVTGEPLTYENWASSEPNQAQYRCSNSGPGSIGDAERCYEHCLGMNGTGKWTDRRCDQEDGYVCEWEPAGE